MPKESTTELTDESKASATRISKLYIRYSKVKRKILSKYMKQVRIVLLLAIVSFIGGFLFVTSNVIRHNYFVQVANEFLFTPSDGIEQFEGRTNILLLGKADGDINTPYLTDTLIFASIKHENPQSMTLISVPRDIWVPEIEDKINAAYHVGEQKQLGGGLRLAKSSVEEVIGLPIQYAIAIDTSHLADAVDVVGGIEVEIQNSFTDRQFPIKGKENEECTDGDVNAKELYEKYPCRYETLHFEKGVSHMDGITALKFSRSRHAEEEIERTDFARTARQQQVLKALQQKILSKETLSNYSRLSSLYSLGRNSIETDITDSQIALLARRVMQAKSNLKQSVLSKDLLLTPPLIATYNFLYVLVPKAGDWSEVHNWVIQQLF